MAWIESHQELGRHPKTRKAARALGASVPTMIGHLHCLWHECLDLAEDGDLSRWDPEDIAVAAQWDGDPEAFVDALLSCGYAGGAGFLERGGSCGHPSEGRTGDLVLHDWWEYAGKLVERRRRDRQRKSDARAPDPPQDVQRNSEGCPQDSPQDVQGMSGPHARAPARATRHDPTEPDPTQPHEHGAAGASPPDPADEQFGAFWDAYPRNAKSGKPGGGAPRAEALKRWHKLSAADREAALVGVEHYADYCARPDAEFPAHATTWLNQRRWEDWQQPAEPPKANGRPPPNGGGPRGVGDFTHVTADDIANAHKR